MDDFLKFLLIAGVILIGVFREANKNKSKKAQNKHPNPSMPPTTEAAPDDAPFPTAWEKMILPPRRSEQNATEKPVTQSQNKNPKKQVTQLAQSPRSHASPGTPSGAEEPQATEDFTIHSAEEARRAIIWGEILQRKY